MISFRELGAMGRLGNQLFQIAATIALAVRNNDDYLFPSWPEEVNFNLHNCFSGNIPAGPVYSEPFFHYSPIPYQQNLSLRGFFQSEKYFEDSFGLIQQLLTPKFGHNIKYNCTAIHVRRGDYLSLTREYAQLDMSYYNNAMRTINSKEYIIFSDDINWCKAHFSGNVSFSEGQTPAQDLALMLSCEHTIIANSSFSWWGAYLNKNPSKIVVAPQNWFGAGLPHDTKDLLPASWIKL